MVYTLILYKSYFIKPKLFQLKKKKEEEEEYQGKCSRANSLIGLLLRFKIWYFPTSREGMRIGRR